MLFSIIIHKQLHSVINLVRKYNNKVNKRWLYHMHHTVKLHGWLKNIPLYVESHCNQNKKPILGITLCIQREVIKSRERETEIVSTFLYQSRRDLRIDWVHLRFCKIKLRVTNSLFQIPWKPYWKCRICVEISNQKHKEQD